MDERTGRHHSTTRVTITGLEMSIFHEKKDYAKGTNFYKKF